MEIIHNKDEEQFEVRINDQLAELQYRIRNNTLFLLHTWVPESFEGKGIGSALANAALNYAKAVGLCLRQVAGEYSILPRTHCSTFSFDLSKTLARTRWNPVMPGWGYSCS